MDERKVRGLMGLCVRAGQGVFGEEGCRKAVTSGQCGILLADAGISENSRKRYEDLCKKAGIIMVVLPEGLLEDATGKPGVAMAVRQGTFSEQLISINNCKQLTGSNQ